MNGSSFQSKAPTSVIGKLGASLFLSFFLGMGLLFAWLTVRDAGPRLQTWTWPRADCLITSSSVRETDDQEKRSGNFYFDVNYRYNFAGHEYTGDRLRRKPRTFPDYTQAARLADRYRPGAKATCFVDPSAPAEAVLERESLLFPLVVLFPMLFVAIGAGGIYFTWRPKPAAEAEPQPISELAAGTKGRRFMLLFFAIFLLVGCGGGYALFFRPMFKIVAARNWLSVPCVVLSSEVRTHNNSDGDTYSVNIFYRYEFKDREFKSNRYHFQSGSSSGHGGKAAVVARYPPGAQAVCYVNPHDPTEAVLERGFTPDLWFGLIPLVFGFVGGGGIYFTLRKTGWSGGNSRAEGAPAWTLPASAAAVALKPRMSPIVKLLAITAIALFWNGIVSVFVGQAVQGWRSGRPDWFLTIFMVPFVLVGLAFLAGVIYAFLALFNPRPRLTISPAAVPLGGALRVEWEIRGRTEALRSWRIWVEGREEATYRRGTSTSTDKSVFARLDLANLTDSLALRSGAATVTIPANSMHSFASKNNKLVWSIQVHGEIPRWPDIRDEYVLTVLPGSTE